MNVNRLEIEIGVVGVASKVFGIDAGSLSMKTRWKEDLGVKSIHGMKICALLNHQFNIKMPMSTLIRGGTLSSTAEAIESLITIN